MGQNFYEVLGLPKGTSDAAQIKKAYRKQALRFHPDKPTGDKEKFQAISEAFEVLSDPKKKKLYDQFGEAGLGAGGGDTQDVPFTRATASGARRPGAGASHQTFSFSTNRGGGGGGGGGFQHSDPFSIFESIFGTGDVHKVGETEGFGGFPMGGGAGMSGMGGMGGGFNGMGGMPNSPGTQAPRRQAPPVEHILNLSLEELYKGSSKRMRITKKTASGGSQQVDKTIAIKPGWKDGTKITYKEEGDEQPGMVPADIVFVIKTKPHSRFEREDNNLVCTVIITLEQALTGFSIPIDTLDGRRVMASEPGGIPSSSHETTIRGEGMPSQRDQKLRGNLTVRYSVEFPEPAKTEAKKAQRRQAMERL